MYRLEEEIDEAIQILQFKTEDFRRCDKIEASDVVAKARAEFVSNNPRVWWLTLKHIESVTSFEKGDGYLHLSEYISDKEHFWFIPETGQDELPVFETNVEAVTKLLGECTSFEYNLVGKTMSWLLVENDHNQIIFSTTQSVKSE